VATGYVTLNDLDLNLKLILFLGHFASNPNQFSAIFHIQKSNQNPQIFGFDLNMGDLMGPNPMNCKQEIPR
jgi:hypothetical protein